MTALVDTILRGIILPVSALLKQYKENPDSSMIRHFDLMFIQQSVGKLSSSVRLANEKTNGNNGLTMMIGTNGSSAGVAARVIERR